MIAGLEVLRIINEPTAAAIAYGLDKKKQMGAKESQVRRRDWPSGRLAVVSPLTLVV